MERKNIWKSPDNKIKKEIVVFGVSGIKPSENCICIIETSDVKFKTQPLPSEYLVEKEKYPLEIVIGEANTAVDREIDLCLQTMNTDEESVVTIYFSENEVSFLLKLCSFELRGYIFTWDTKEKWAIAVKHKEKAVELFKQNRYIDASFRISKALKLILAIPIPVDESPVAIEGVEIAEINKFKANLYHGLASCNFKEKLFETTLELCNKVLEIDENNIKALYKRGFSYAEMRNFEKAKEDFTKLLTIETDNVAAKKQLNLINYNIKQQELNYSEIVKKMFSK